MKKLFLLCLLGLVVGAALALLLADDPGYVLVHYHGYSVEATLGSVVLALLALYLLYRLLRWLLPVVNPLRLLSGSTWKHMFGHSNPVQASSEGMDLLLLGRWQEAYKLLVENAERVDNPAFNYIAAALAAMQRQDRHGWHYCLEQAGRKSQAGSLGIKSLRALLEARTGHAEQALALLLALQRAAPDSPFVLAQIKEIYLQLGDWENLAELLPHLEKAGVATGKELLELSEQLYFQRLTRAAAEGLDSLHMVWHDLPKALRYSEKLTGLYLQKLLHFRQDSEADSILSRQLKHEWSDNLIGMLGHIAVSNPQQQLLLLESWLKGRPNNAVLLLTLGRLSLRNHLWRKARDYFEHALRSSNSAALSAEISAELARLLEHLGEREKSLDCYHKAMQMMDRKLPELPMPMDVH